MSFRGHDNVGEAYFALVPGHREAAAMLALVEDADKVPQEERRTKSEAAGARPG